MTALVGILNITPDSFSDGGQYLDARRALAAAGRMLEDGAQMIDIGAESTRPGAIPIGHEEEWRRLSPLLPLLRGIPWSMDTRHPQTARKALEMGASWINDVSGFRSPAMLEAVAGAGCRLVVMHSLSVPADRQAVLAEEVDAVAEIMRWAYTHMGYMQEKGIDKKRIIFDPGIGFGKSAAHSWQVIRNASAFRALGVPLLIGHSRKSFLGEGDRDKLTLEVSRDLAAQGVEYLRVHHVRAHRELL